MIIDIYSVHNIRYEYLEKYHDVVVEALRRVTDHKLKRTGRSVVLPRLVAERNRTPFLTILPTGRTLLQRTSAPLSSQQLDLFYSPAFFIIIFDVLA